MNEELQQAIVKVIESMTGVAQSAYSFGAEQMPEVIEQLLFWETTKSALFFALSLMLLVSACFGLRYMFSDDRLAERKAAANAARNAYKAGESWTRYGGGGSVTSSKYDEIIYKEGAKIATDEDLAIVIFLLVSCGLSFYCSLSSLTWLKILIAPKVWLIEYAAGLVK